MTICHMSSYTLQLVAHIPWFVGTRLSLLYAFLNIMDICRTHVTLQLMNSYISWPIVY